MSDNLQIVVVGKTIRPNQRQSLSDLVKAKLLSRADCQTFKFIAAIKLMAKI